MNSNFQSYPAYKPSYVDWLGDIPAHWGQLPGRACYTEKKVPNVGMRESTVLSLSYGRIVVRPPEKLHGLVPESFETYQIVEPGDIVVRSTDLQNDWNSLRFGLCRRRGIITSAYICLKTNGVMSRDYGHLLLHSYDLKKVFYGLGSGLRQNLSWDDFRYLPCLVPPLTEQRAIARYLDHVDRRIQRYIEAKEQLIALLQEARQAIIQRAVTRGLDSGVLLKPSGVDWLGDVPAHWEVEKASRLFAIGSGTTPPTENGEFYGGGIPWITTSELRENVVRSTEKTVTEKALRTFPALNVFPEGSVAVAMYGATIGRLGILGVPATVNQACCVFSGPKGMNVHFWFYWLQSRRHYLISRGHGGGQPNLSQKLLRSIQVPFPSFPEQTTIVAHLHQATATIDRAIDNARRQAERMAEYRASLIAHVVTGKVDVRAAAERTGAESS